MKLYNCDFGIDPFDMSARISAESALEWIEQNTSLHPEDAKDLPASAKLFVRKYVELVNLPIGVSSESIEGLSQSFTDGGTANLIYDLAKELLGPYLKSRIRFIPMRK